MLIGGQGDKQQINKDSVWTLDTGIIYRTPDKLLGLCFRALEESEIDYN